RAVDEPIAGRAPAQATFAKLLSSGKGIVGARLDDRMGRTPTPRRHGNGRQRTASLQARPPGSPSMPSQGDVLDLVRPLWPPLRHVRRGWEHLTADERATVQHRVEVVLRAHRWGPGRRDALAHLFTFLAQVETIAIEIPLRALPTA